MKKNFLKKMALTLALVMSMELVSPGTPVGNQTTVEAATVQKKSCHVGESVAIKIGKFKAGATYSCTADKEDMVQTQFIEPYEKNLYVMGLQVGTTTVKVKETYKKKTKTLSTVKLTIKQYEGSSSSYFNEEIFPYDEEEDTHYLKLQIGDMVSNKMLSYGDCDVSIKDTGIADVENGFVCAKSAGQTKINIKSGKKITDTMPLIVVKRKDTTTTTKAAEINAKLDELYAKPVTTSSAIAYYNEYASYQNQLAKLLDYECYESKANLWLMKYPKTMFFDKISAVINDKIHFIDNEGISLEGIKIKSTSKKKATVTLPKALNEYDVLHEYMYSSWYFGDSLSIVKSDSTFAGEVRMDVGCYSGKWKAGMKKATFKLNLWDKKAKAGYYYTISDDHKISYHKVSIKK